MRVEGRGEEYGVIHLRATSAQSLELFLLANSIDASRVDELLWLGSVYVNNVRVEDPMKELAAGDTVRVHSNPRRFVQVKDLRKRIVFETDEYIIVDKPPGLPVHALTDNSRENLLAFLQRELTRELFITHRLDIETSGLLIVALTAEAQESINRRIAAREIVREYHAWVEHEVALGRYVHYMSPSPKAPKMVVENPEPGWLECVLRVEECMLSDEMKAKFPTKSEQSYRLRIQLETGRTQQIRAQLAAIGAPILGDIAYHGSSRSSLERAIALKAYALKIDGRRIEI